MWTNSLLRSVVWSVTFVGELVLSCPPDPSLPALCTGCWWRMEQVKLWCCAGMSMWQQCWAWAFSSGKLCRTVCRAGAVCTFSTGKLLEQRWVGYSRSSCWAQVSAGQDFPLLWVFQSLPASLRTLPGNTLFPSSVFRGIRGSCCLLPKESV